MTPKRKTLFKPAPIAHRIEQYAKTNAFVLKGKVIAHKGGKTGRPTVMTQEVVGKLEHAFVYDCTVEEACLYAGIAPDTYYTFCKQYPDFSERITLLRHAPYFVIRKTILVAAEHDANLALKYLERKLPQEFSTRAQVHHTGEVSDRHSVDPEQIALIKKAMGNWVKKVGAKN
ncbi:MAG: hypothetical protein AAB447_03865 [Patescibacteria group bacterium]